MDPLTQTLNIIFSISALGMLALGLWLILGRLIPGLIPQGIRRLVTSNTLALVLLLSLGSVVGSLVYSDVIGYAPCSLCWLQRICMYPLALIAIVGLKYKDQTARRYILPLVTIGVLIASYHLVLTYMPTANIPCPAGSVSCALRFVNTFGFVTIPLMSFSFFLGLLGILVTKKESVR